MAHGHFKGAQSEANPEKLHSGPEHPLQPAASLRPVGREDLPELLRLEALFPGDRLSARQLRYHLGSARALWRVAATPAGDVHGYLLVLLHARQHSARLYSLVVDPDRRGQGLADRLLAAAETELSRRGVAALRLEVREDNQAAIALYRRRGYRDLGRRPGYYEDGAAALCMRLDLIRGGVSASAD